MGFLSAIWKYSIDPTDATAPYTPYTFIPAGHAGVANMTMNRDFGRRESVLSIPGADDVLDEYGRLPAPRDRMDQTFGFRRFTGGDNDAEYDRLAAWLAPGNAVRLLYTTDAGAIWYAKAFNPRVQNTETSAGNWKTGGYQDFTVTWRRGVWTPGHTETAELFRAATTFAASTTFGSLGTTTIASANQSFTIDATGVAGATLPTLPDTGAIITVTGPAGGTGGLRIYNGTPDILAVDENGTEVPMRFDIPFQLPTASDVAILRFASQKFVADGFPFRPLKPNYQREYFKVAAGVVNSCAAVGLGTGILTGGKVKVDWTRRRA